MSLDYREIAVYVEEHIGPFHAARLRSLEAITLTTILKRKNPYLFRAKNIRTAEALVKTLFDAYLSSQEETIFGEFLPTGDEVGNGRFGAPQPTVTMWRPRLCWPFLADHAGNLK